MRQANQAPGLSTNRIMDIVLLYAQLETEHRVSNPTSRKDSPDALATRANQYENILSGYRKMKGLTRQEKNTRSFVRYDLLRTKAKMNPTVANRVLYSQPVQSVLNFLKGTYENRAIHDKVLAGYEKKTTLDTNVVSILQQMKAAGFKDHVAGLLRQLLAYNNVPAVTLPYTDSQKPDVRYELHLKKIPGTNVFSFDQYQVAVRADSPSGRKKETFMPKLTVPMTNGISLNAQEARQLAKDHAIEKISGGVPVWLVRDPTSRSGIKEVSFDLQTALKAWPIKEMLPERHSPAILKALSTGREQDITLISQDGLHHPLKVSVGPSPNGNSVQLYFRTPEGSLVDGLNIQTGHTPQDNVIKLIQSVAPQQVQKSNLLQRLFWGR